MKNIGTGISRAILTLAVAGMGLAPQTASADIIFEVDETVVDDTAVFCAVITNDCTFQSDRLNGSYSEILTINA